MLQNPITVDRAIISDWHPDDKLMSCVKCCGKCTEKRV